MWMLGCAAQQRRQINHPIRATGQSINSQRQQQLAPEKELVAIRYRFILRGEASIIHQERAAKHASPAGHLDQQLMRQSHRANIPRHGLPRG
jgi:hypothetical protein